MSWVRILPSALDVFLFTHTTLKLSAYVYYFVCFDIGILISLFFHIRCITFDNTTLLYYFVISYLHSYITMFLCIFISENTALLYLYISVSLYCITMFLLKPRIIWASTLYVALYLRQHRVSCHFFTLASTREPPHRILLPIRRCATVSRTPRYRLLLLTTIIMLATHSRRLLYITYVFSQLTRLEPANQHAAAIAILLLLPPTAPSLATIQHYMSRASPPTTPLAFASSFPIASPTTSPRAQHTYTSHANTLTSLPTFPRHGP